MSSAPREGTQRAWCFSQAAPPALFARKEQAMGTCEDFVITMKNACDEEIEATKLEYKDGPRWRREVSFGVGRHQKIGKHRQITLAPHALRGVGGEPTQLRVTYKHHLGGSQWGPSLVKTTHPFIARDNGKKTIVLAR